jgi:hypothetical protein
MEVLIGAGRGGMESALIRERRGSVRIRLRLRRLTESGRAKMAQGLGIWIGRI